MARRKNPRYRPMPPGWAPDREGATAGHVASKAGPPAVLERPSYSKPWIERPLSRPQAELLRAAAAGTALVHAGRVSIAGRYASIVTLRHLRERGLITGAGVHLTDSGREAISFHRLQD